MNLNQFITQFLLTWMLSHQSFRTLHWALLIFFRFAWALSSSQWRILWMASLPSGKSTAPHSLVSSATLLRVHSTPWLCSWWDVKWEWPQYRVLRHIPFTAVCHLDTVCHMDMVSQFIIHLQIHLSNSYLSSLEARMLWGTPSGLTEVCVDDIPCPLTPSLHHRPGQQIRQNFYTVGWA